MELADCQRQKMLEFESGLLRLKAYKTNDSPDHKNEPAIQGPGNSLKQAHTNEATPLPMVK